MIESTPIEVSRQTASFATTRWSVLLAATDPGAPDSHAALERLCRTYWYPLYAFVRRQGRSAEDAQDLTQSFFERLLESDYLRTVDRSKGKFRSFLLATLDHFLTREWAKAQRLKRGGGATFLSFDALAAEERYQFEPEDPFSPDQVFDRRWAMTVLDLVMTKLRQECAALGKEALFDAVRPSLSAARGEGHAAAARKLNMTEGAVNVAVHRLRHRFGELVRAEIGKTVGSQSDLDEELKHLFSALGT